MLPMMPNHEPISQPKNAHAHSVLCSALLNPLPCLLPSPNLVRAFLPFSFRYPPRDKPTENQGQGSEDIVDSTLFAECFVQDWEELGDNEGRHPIGCQGPTLSGAYGFWADKLICKDEWNWAESEAEGGYK